MALLPPMFDAGSSEKAGSADPSDLDLSLGEEDEKIRAEAFESAYDGLAFESGHMAPQTISRSLLP